MYMFESLSPKSHTRQTSNLFRFFLTALFFCFLASLQIGCQSSKKSDEKSLFTQLDSTQTQVGFVNKLVPNDKLNIIDYLYFYNGGGVATGDVNGDGLADLFFVSNQGKNKLYLNKGNMKFEDISAKAGIEGMAEWKTGVTMADINGDGFLDIYVCAVGNYRGIQGANSLYINNGGAVPTFTEKATDYGLAFKGFSTQAAFFDYDHDGDLDCYLLNHAVHTSRTYDRVTTRLLIDNQAGDFLYKNNNGRFVDVSKQAGIYQAAMGYGLGIAVADLNNDGWEDLYISNDFHEDDYFYINQKNGTFKESIKEKFGHLSRFSMGSDIADVNNDGLPDIMTLDMYPNDETIEKSSSGEDAFDIFMYKLQYGYFNQYSRNCLQLNVGNGHFAEVGSMAGVSATDWSWSPLFADYDNDGIKDLFITNGIPKRPNDLEYIKYISNDSLHYADDVSRQLDQKAFNQMPTGDVHNFLFRGSKSLIFEDKSAVWGFDKKGCSNGAVYADLDNDGDLDLVTNDINAQAGIFKNNANEQNKNNFLAIKLAGNNANTSGLGAKVILKTKGQTQYQEMMTTRGFMSSVAPVIHFGLAGSQNIDSLIVIWNTGKAEVITNVRANQSLVLKQQNATLAWQWPAPAAKTFEDISDKFVMDYSHKENQHYDFERESLVPFMVSAEGPALATGDANGDGLEDIYVGGAKYQSGQLFLQNAKGEMLKSKQLAIEADSIYEDVDAVFFDADNDNDLDLYVVSGGNEFFDLMPEQFDRLYINDGKGNYTRNAKALPDMFENKSCVKPCDIDKDGDLDLFVGGRVRSMAYGKTPNSYLLINNGKGIFEDKTKSQAPELSEAGMTTGAEWADIDKDGDQDLVVIGDWMPIKIFTNNGKGSLDLMDFKLEGDIANRKLIANKLENMQGLWQGLCVQDFDNDGDPDLMIGNLGQNTKLRKMGGESAMKMYVKDFDKNNSTEQVVCVSRGEGEFYPIATKDELGKQIPSIINKRYVKYPDFAGKNIEEIFKGAELSGSVIKDVTIFESVYLENKGNGTFVVKALPFMAQSSKIFSILSTDVNADGHLDVLLGGNDYGVSTYQGRYDAITGLALMGDGKGGFETSLPSKNGFLLNGEVRNIKTLKTPQGLRYLVARNGQKLQVFQKKIVLQ